MQTQVEVRSYHWQGEAERRWGPAIIFGLEKSFKFAANFPPLQNQKKLDSWSSASTKMAKDTQSKKRKGTVHILSPILCQVAHKLFADINVQLQFLKKA
jgi:hypothetical protein